ncbi:hypothetical protein GCM10022226_17290 [Sphaerisporangium flaviroseum]|uniref:Uncharacterized protein n=2 Tax=Sphaerisporangium flaviroseum TaxID=509199 RepID=A0ABP7HQE6_9ACTN
MVDRIKDYLRTPKGQAHMEKAKTMARDPRHQQKLRDLVNRWRARRTH